MPQGLTLPCQHNVFNMVHNGRFSFVSELKGIMAKELDYAQGGEKELENIIQDTKRFPKLLRRLKPQDVEEDGMLQGRTSSEFFRQITIT